MIIKVDLSKITDSPINNSNVKESNSFQKLKMELLQGSPTSYLVSGYRGVGKTSFINTLVQEINSEIKEKNSNTNQNKLEKLFVNLKVSKYKDFSLIIRSLIREIYLSIDESSEIKSKIKEKDEKLYEEIRLLHIRTFKDVSIKKNYLIETNLSKGIGLNPSTVNIFIRTFFLIFGGFGLIDYFKKGEVNWTFVSMLIFIMIVIFIAEFSYKKNKEESDEISQKTLYDDEIAESQLYRVINGLHQINIELVIIIDELDKIEEETEINSFISELKPLLLNGKTNFVLIFGQRMLYKYLMADIEEDNLVRSIFTRNIHIPLPSSEVFENYFYSLIKDTNYDSDLIEQYIQANILSSNRVLRKFIGVVRNDIFFDEDGNAVLNIESDNKLLKTNAQISKIIRKIEEEIICSEKSVFSEVEQDYLVYFLYITINKIKRMRHVEFNIEDILIENDLSKNAFMNLFYESIKEHTETLIEQLVQNEILVNLHSSDSSDESYGKELPRYKWSDNVAIENKYHLSSPFLFFLNEYIHFEKWMRDLSESEYLLGSESKNTHRGIYFIMQKLHQKEVISRKLLSEFQEFNNLRNQIAHGMNIADDPNNEVRDITNQFIGFQTLIFEQMMIFLLNKINSKSNQYDCVEDFKGYPAINNILFEFKLVNTNQLTKLLKLYSRMMDENEEIKEVRVLIFSPTLSNKLSSEIPDKNKNPKLKIKAVSSLTNMDYEDFLTV
ncbi:P-loop NTPase fold protein [Exiguobacterium sp. s57]|uniref:P-loop NTPase fold protein n=1 Tax=Exiguobacterium sp. s57 TaxID=2751258 RepID=UPI001BE75777|nr:P-loop NTPase fold protein [Exiguobacterium sp. s57]